MEKLSSLINAAADFGQQSEQLSKSRGDFDSYLATVKETNRQMLVVVEKCNEYIEIARRLVEKDLSAQIERIVESTEEAVKDCKIHCQEVTAEYEAVVKLFEQQKSVLDDQRNQMVYAVNSGFESEAGNIKEACKKLEEVMGNASRSLSECLTSTETNISEFIQKCFDEGYTAADKDKKELLAELAIIKDELSQIKSWQQKNDLFIKIAAIAACIGAIATIVGLFI